MTDRETTSPDTPSTGLPRMALYAGVFLTSLALITLEVALTRVFSVMIWNHLSFMAISIALLGFSLAGLFFFFFPITLRIPTPGLLAIGTLGFLGGMYMVGYYILGSGPYSEQLGVQYGAMKGAARYLIYLFALLVVPFFFCGFTISAAIVKEARDVGKVYAANLLGSGAACLAVIGCLNVFGAFRTLLLVFCLALLSFVCYVWRRRGWWVTVVLGIPALVLLGLTVKQIVTIQSDQLLIRPIALTKKRVDANVSNTLLRKWNSFSCVDFYPKDPYEGFWGLNRDVYKGTLPNNLGVLIDSWALTTIPNVEDGLERSEVFRHVPSSFPYAVFAKRNRAPEVLILGSGGGIDVLPAKHFGASHVDAVEINPLIVNASLRKYPELKKEALLEKAKVLRDPRLVGWTDKSVYELPGVHVHVAEGRNFVDRSKRFYDLIMIPGVDTATGTEAGSFSFSENYLYTVDAMEAYLSKLKADGLVYVLRFKVTERPSEMLRLAAIAEEALRRRGVAEPTKQMFVYHSRVHVFACLVMKQGGPFTEDELDVLHEKAEALRCQPLYSPRLPRGRRVPAARPAGDLPEPPAATDAPARTVLVGGNDPDVHDYLHGADRAKFLADYPYRVAPVTDDAPFFFNFTRLGDVFKPARELEKGEYILYYIGQTVLYYCLFAVLGLGIFFIVLPLLKFSLQRTKIPGRWRFVGYFLALGFAYIVVEIILMQKFVFFLGYPVYALTVILFSLLTFSGLGSLVSSRFRGGRGLASLFILLIGVQVALIFLFDPITRAAFTLPLVGRIVVAVAITGPLGFLMGMPFPVGIRYAESHAGAMLPWVWSLNGYASVLGSVLSVALAIHVGFTTVLCLAIGVYVVAFLLLTSIHRTVGDTT